MSRPRPITVKKLISLLQMEDPSRIIVLSTERDGGRFNVLHTVYPAAYDPTHREIGLEDLTKEDIAQGFTTEDTLPDGRPALILTP